MKIYASELIENGKRTDDRKFEEFREIKVKTDVIKNAEGSAMVSFGETKVIAGVKIDAATPFPDTPDEGMLMVSAEFTPLASPDFEAGPPSDDSVELARVVDRGIRESHMIDLKKMCVKEGESVLGTFVDIHVINNSGNLIDCAALAAVAALNNAKVPKVDEEGKIVRGEIEGDLPVEGKPVTITVCKVGDKLLVDPAYKEEDAIDAKLSICIRDDGMVCALQKQGVEGITLEEIEKMVELADKKSAELRKLL